jgi:hypothetical protein
VPGDWNPRSRYDSGTVRSAAVKATLQQLVTDRQAATTAIALHADAQSVLDAVAGTLLDDPPAASQAAELALLLSAFTIAEQRVLNLADPGVGDVTEMNARLAGDRTLSEWLSGDLLEPLNIPVTKGALASSSFRAGYLARQVRGAARDFVAWHGTTGRTVDEVEAFAEALTDRFLAVAVAMPALPSLRGSAFTWTAYRRAREHLLADGSNGAMEQYLLAGLLEQELPLRVVTKAVGSSDASAGTAGDVEIREGQRLVGAIEVTARSWDTKVAQLSAAATAGLTDPVIAAAGANDAEGDDIAALLDPAQDRLALDVAVLDLHAYMDVVASRITRHQRAAAFAFVHSCCVRYHRARPELAGRVVAVLVMLGLTTDDGEDPAVVEVAPLDTDTAGALIRVQEALSPGAGPVDPERLAADLRVIADQLDPEADA